MKQEPCDWNVVIAGSWNRAILTPNGIAKRLFKLPEGTGIQVLVPVDLLQPPKVKHGGIVATVDERRLIIGTETPTWEALAKAMQTGCNALADLPETPVLAAGVNVRFEIRDCVSQVEDIVQCVLDTHLSDAGYEIVTTGLTRSLRVKDDVFKEGVLNLSLHKKEPGSMRMEVNFHRDSKTPADLIKWLQIPMDKLKEQTVQLLQNADLPFEEIQHE